MESLFILIPLSVAIVALAVLIFFRMNKQGQFDDDLGPAMSILMDNDRVETEVESNDERTDSVVHKPLQNKPENSSENTLNNTQFNGPDNT